MFLYTHTFNKSYQLVKKIHYEQHVQNLCHMPDDMKGLSLKLEKLKTEKTEGTLHFM